MTASDVAREARTTVTLHATASSVAIRIARETVENALGAFDGGDGRPRSAVLSAEVDEHPVAPFEPYRIDVTFEAVVAVDAADEDEALELGAGAIDDALGRTELENWRYTSEPAIAP